MLVTPVHHTRGTLGPYRAAVWLLLQHKVEVKGEEADAPVKDVQPHIPLVQDVSAPDINEPPTGR